MTLIHPSMSSLTQPFGHSLGTDVVSIAQQHRVARVSAHSASIVTSTVVSASVDGEVGTRCRLSRLRQTLQRFVAHQDCSVD